MGANRWSWKSHDGEIIIEQKKKYRFELLFNGLWLGTYHTADSALRDAVRGAHFSHPSGLRTSDLAPPEALADWMYGEAGAAV